MNCARGTFHCPESLTACLLLGNDLRRWLRTPPWTGAIITEAHHRGIFYKSYNICQVKNHGFLKDTVGRPGTRDVVTREQSRSDSQTLPGARASCLAETASFWLIRFSESFCMTSTRLHSLVLICRSLSIFLSLRRENFYFGVIQMVWLSQSPGEPQFGRYFPRIGTNL